MISKCYRRQSRYCLCGHFQSWGVVGNTEKVRSCGISQELCNSTKDQRRILPWVLHWFLTLASFPVLYCLWISSWFHLKYPSLDSPVPELTRGGPYPSLLWWPRDSHQVKTPQQLLSKHAFLLLNRSLFLSCHIDHCHLFKPKAGIHAILFKCNYSIISLLRLPRWVTWMSLWTQL